MNIWNKIFGSAGIEVADKVTGIVDKFVHTPDEKVAFNFQGTGAVQWLIGIPLMILPMVIFGLINWLIGFETATATIAVMGFVGIALHKKLMAAITKKYITNKYVMIHAFNQEN